MDTFYRERAGGRWIYWTYSEGLKVTLKESWALRQIERRTAKLVTC